MKGKGTSVHERSLKQLFIDPDEGWHKCGRTIPDNLNNALECSWEGRVLTPLNVFDTPSAIVCLRVSAACGDMWYTAGGGCRFSFRHFCSMVDVATVGARLFHFIIYRWYALMKVVEVCAYRWDVDVDGLIQAGLLGHVVENFGWLWSAFLRVVEICMADFSGLALLDLLLLTTEAGIVVR